MHRGLSVAFTGRQSSAERAGAVSPKPCPLKGCRRRRFSTICRACLPNRLLHLLEPPHLHAQKSSACAALDAPTSVR